MSIVRRLIVAVAGVVLVLAIAAVGTFVWVARQFRPVQVFQVEAPNRAFQFWVDLPFLDEGDPSLVLAAGSRDGKKAERHLLGFMDWGDTDHVKEWIDLEAGEIGAFGFVVSDDEPSKPLLLWRMDSGDYVPTDNDSELEAPWVSAALSMLADQEGDVACLGYLAGSTMGCRYGSPEIRPRLTAAK